ncbi:MAG: InlB B-repeat-containing protein, partial [Firmicutes bacterium]|nr:InlB B-repeat-containing protein [Bacillota bacterium]
MKKKYIVLCIILALTLGAFALWACDGDEGNPDGTIPQNKCTLAFDTVGGSPVPSVTYDKNGIAALPQTIPSKRGHVFTGWYFDAAYADMAPLAWQITENTTLYAEWEEFPRFTLSFDTNGGSPVASEWCYLGESIPKPAASPAKTGFRFDGWYWDETLLVPAPFPLPMIDDDTVYAKWLAQVTLTFDANGGSAVASRTVDAEAPIEKPTDPKRAGYAFGGWYQSANFTGTARSFPVAITQDTTLYARWYGVTFNSNGGSEITSFSVTGSTVSKPADPKRDGYVFDGWYQNAGLTAAAAFPFNVTQNTVFYAKWLATYTVTFETDGGSNTNPLTRASGASVSKPADPTKAGFVFDGWYQDAAFTMVRNFPFAVTQDTVVYAKWLASVTVTFETNGGTDVKPAVIAKDSSFSDPIVTFKTGYVISEWCTDPGLTQTAVFPLTVSQDITLYAKWTEFKIQSASGGSAHTIALDKAGNIWAWGSNTAGRLGDGTTVNRSVPTQVTKGTVFLQVAAGVQHNLALDSAGNLWTWGYNGFGQLGDGVVDGKLVDKGTPTLVDTQGTKFKQISA